MNSNRDLLKEAIADAKAVKETAIANAKAALEESFGPFLREKLAAKLSEIDKMDEVENEVEEGYGEENMEESYETNEAETNEMDETAEVDEAKEETDEVLDLEALLRELDGIEEGEEDINENEDLLNDPKGPTAKGNVAEEEETDEEEINIEDMSAEDLKDFIESVIADMVEAGELEAGEGMEGEEEGEEGKEEMMDEVDLEELMAEVKKAKIFEKKKEEEDKKVKEVEKKLKEAYDAIEAMQSTLNEVNLLNAKLLYTNKIFKAKSLTESQKVKVLTAFDKATSKKEAQLVYETLLEGLKEKKTSINESMLGSASKVIGGPAPKQPIIEVNNQFARWQKLAGIK